MENFWEAGCWFEKQKQYYSVHINYKTTYKCRTGNGYQMVEMNIPGLHVAFYTVGVISAFSREVKNET